jgi:hypothetical protein
MLDVKSSIQEEIKINIQQTQKGIDIMKEIDKKRNELFAAKGFITKVDMELIEESYRDQVNQLID